MTLSKYIWDLYKESKQGKETIDFFGHNIEIDFDFCKIVEPASGAFYYLFYV